MPFFSYPVSFHVKTIIGACLVTALLVPVCIRLAHVFGVLDKPDKRKIHAHPIPLLGGLAIYFGFLGGLLSHLAELQEFLPLLLAGTIILIVGLIDDVRKLSARFRLVCQVLCALIIITAGEKISILPPNPVFDSIQIVVTVIWMVGVTNAYNYLDGMDGLATGSAAINLFCFAAILFMTGQEPLSLVCIILLAACLGFLPYNFRNARIFLGDAGSTFLGFMLAGIALVGNWAEDSMVKVSIPLLIMGVPIFDMIFTTIMRIKEEKVRTVIEWLKYAGKDHFHHYLVDLGLRKTSAVIFIYLVTFSLGISAVMVSNDSATEGLMSLAQATIVFVVIATLIVVGKRRHSGWHEK